MYKTKHIQNFSKKYDQAPAPVTRRAPNVQVLRVDFPKLNVLEIQTLVCEIIKNITRYAIE